MDQELFGVAQATGWKNGTQRRKEKEEWWYHKMLFVLQVVQLGTKGACLDLCYDVWIKGS